MTVSRPPRCSRNSSAPAGSAAYADPDVETIVLLSDGEPTTSTPEQILASLRTWDELRGIVVHKLSNEAIEGLGFAVPVRDAEQALGLRWTEPVLPQPDGPPETWSLATRARASYYPGRSGDLIVALKPRVTPIADPTRGYVATHGSFWDYDRRVPILFWRQGMAGFEQPLGVETVDIMPTLASLIGVAVPSGEIDGRCLDLDPGAASNCLAAPAADR